MMAVIIDEILKDLYPEEFEDTDESEDAEESEDNE